MPENETITCPVQRNAKELYDTFWRPESFPLWASGLSGSMLSRDEVGWKAEAQGVKEPSHALLGVLIGLHL
jgi:hypothetical protein